MKNLLLFLTILCIHSNQIQAQIKSDEIKDDNSIYQKYFKDKLFTGGGAGLALGTITNISLNPILGYRINEKTHVAIGINYQYVNNRFYGVDYSSYGARAFAKHHIIPQAYAIGEYSLMNIEFANRSVWERGWFPSLLIGAGYRQSLGGNSSYNLEALWNIFNSPVYPINYPIIRAGLNIGL